MISASTAKPKSLVIIFFPHFIVHIVIGNLLFNENSTLMLCKSGGESETNSGVSYY